MSQLSALIILILCAFGPLTAMSAIFENWKRRPIALPPNNLQYHPQKRIDLRQLTANLSDKEVHPSLPSRYPRGIEIIFDHAKTTDFRQEYQFNFEGNAAINFDDNPRNGWSSAILADGQNYGKMTSLHNSIRLTSLAMRFRALEFPRLEIKARVTNDLPGANVLKGGNGQDDSAFQIWFTFRQLLPGQNRSLINTQDQLRILGYYWGDAIAGIQLEEGKAYENYYSERNYLVVKMPTTYQILLKYGAANLGKTFLFQRNLIQDLKQAYPGLNPRDTEIIAITLQQDSNDTHGDSEAFFQFLKILPPQ